MSNHVHPMEDPDVRRRQVGHGWPDPKSHPIPGGVGAGLLFLSESEVPLSGWLPGKVRAIVLCLRVAVCGAWSDCGRGRRSDRGLSIVSPGQGRGCKAAVGVPVKERTREHHTG